MGSEFLLGSDVNSEPCEEPGSNHPRSKQRELLLDFCLVFLGYGFLRRAVAGFLGFLLGHELAPLGFPVEFAILVVDLRAGVHPHHAFGTGVVNIRIRDRRGRLDRLLRAGGLGLVRALWSGGLGHPVSG